MQMLRKFLINFQKAIIAQKDEKTKYFCLSVSNYRFAFKGDYSYALKHGINKDLIKNSLC